MAYDYTPEYHRRRNEFIAKLGGKCCCCGSTESLQISQKEVQKDLNGSKLAYRADNEKYLHLFQLVCPEHCRINRPAAPHGNYQRAYRYGCSCDECKEYKADRRLQVKEDRKRRALEKEQAQYAKQS